MNFPLSPSLPTQLCLPPLLFTHQSNFNDHVFVNVQCGEPISGNTLKEECFNSSQLQQFLCYVHFPLPWYFFWLERAPGLCMLSYLPSFCVCHWLLCLEHTGPFCSLTSSCFCSLYAPHLIAPFLNHPCGITQRPNSLHSNSVFHF